MIQLHIDKHKNLPRETATFEPEMKMVENLI